MEDLSKAQMAVLELMIDGQWILVQQSSNRVNMHSPPKERGRDYKLSLRRMNGTQALAERREISPRTFDTLLKKGKIEVSYTDHPFTYYKVKDWPFGDYFEFFRAHGEWSEATFGTTAKRGPRGPLEHLVREVLTELLGVPREKVTEALSYASGVSYDPEEYADAQLLLLDAVRRAQMTAQQHLIACWKKLAINKDRQWPNPTADGAIEHKRD